jgi:hypothetical protein
MGSKVFILFVLLAAAVFVLAAVRNKRPAQSKNRPVGTAAEMGSLTIPRNTTNSFTRAEQLRDQLYSRFEQAASAGIDAIGFTSYRESGQVWFRFDYRLPSPKENLSLRSSLAVTVERFDFHRHELLLTIEITHGARKTALDGVLPNLSDADIRMLVDAAQSGRRISPLTSGRVRSSPLQLWRPSNSVTTLQPDFKQWGLVGLCVLGAVLTALPIALLGVLVLLGAGLALYLYMHQRKTFVLSTGKPIYDPRAGLRLDFWQASIQQLGPRRTAIRQNLLDRLAATSPEGTLVIPEQIWYPGVDGKVEREQIVVRFQRGMGFVQIESYGEDLFVGWDTYVNSGTWAEETLSRGVDRVSGTYAVANRVIPGTLRPSEYDVHDGNFLTEWLHAAVVRTVRLAMEEAKIDQEVDFTIQRGTRNMASGNNTEAGAGTTQSTASRFAGGLRRIG